MVKRIALGLALGAALAGALTQAAPEWIVSLNSCTDQPLLTLAPRGEYHRSDDVLDGYP